MSGFIALHREALDHHLFRHDPARLGAWFWLVAKACWKPTKFDVSGKTITLERGQICASRNQLAKEWGWSPSAVERFLTRLRTEQMIGQEAGQGRSIITICNYAKYQDVSDEPGQETGQATGQASDKHRTAKEQGNKETMEEPNGSSPPKGSTRQKRRSDGTNERADGLNPRATGTNPRAGSNPVVEVPDWIPAEPWDGFVAMRKRKHAAITPRAQQLIIGKLDELRRNGHDPGRVLDQSTVKNWTDVYPLKDQQDHGNRNHQQYDNRDGLERAADRFIHGDYG